MTDWRDVVTTTTSRKKSGGGARKIGRDKVKCARYRAAGTRVKNKARRIAKEAKRQERFRIRRELKREYANV